MQRLNPVGKYLRNTNSLHDCAHTIKEWWKGDDSCSCIKGYLNGWVSLHEFLGKPSKTIRLFF